MGFITTSMKDSYEPYTFSKMLKEALKLLTKSMKLTLPIIIFTFIFSISLFIASTNYTSPLIQDFTYKLLLILHTDPSTPLGPDFFKNLIGIGKDIKQLTIIQTFFSFSSFLFSFLRIISTTYSFTTAYSGEPLSAKGLLKVFKKRWYQTLITQVYILIFNLGFGVLSWSLIGVAMLMTKSFSLCMCMAFITFSIQIYLVTGWQLSLVVTVNEESYGIEALSKAVILFKGNKKKGCAITCFGLLVEITMYVTTLMFIAKFTKDVETGLLIVINLGFIALISVFSIYLLAVYAVYYFECRKSHGIGDEECDKLLPSTTKV